MSAINPHSKRECRRSSIVGISRGGQSLVMTICFLSVVKRIEGVEELLLRTFLSGHELDVIHQEDVDIAVLLPELVGAIETDRVDQVVHETFGGHVAQAQPGRLPGDEMADGVHQVGLAEPDTAVNVKRVIGLRRLFGHSQGGGSGKLIGGAHDKGIKGVFGIEQEGSGFRLRQPPRGEALESAVPSIEN